MVSTLVFDDIKNRMLNVFGKFLHKLGEFPMKRLLSMGKSIDDAEIPISKLSKELAPRFNFLDSISTKRINATI